MSGDIFQPMEIQDDPDQPTTRNPLLCYLCNEPYEEPCILGCFHSFCARCLRGRTLEGKMVCPLCSLTHTLKDGSNLPPQDLLLKFMVESSTEEKAQCANCDCSSVQMFFCNTCMQPLCSQCREETHRAKMFSSHDMVLLTKRAREVHKKCKIHEEPYIMFSSEKKIMLCINCFRDMRIESRGHCLDLETAYKQTCKKLDLKVQAFRELQNSVREGILLFRGLVEEIKNNADKERKAIQELHANLIRRLDETQVILLQKVDSQYSEKESTFKSQLKSLSALVPTLHTHLVVSSAFSGSANKFEFLDLSYVLMERLKSIVQKQHPLHATLSGQIDTGFKTEYFKSIEPLLYVPAQRPTLNTAASATNGAAAVSTGTSCPGSPVTSKITPTHARRSNGLNGAKVKFIDAKGQFAEHCKEFENAHRDLLQRFDQMKSQCQELQRDLTMRRCLAKRDEVLKLGDKIEDVQAHLERHYSTLENKLPLLEKHWEESLDRIVNEQDLYQAQLQDVMRLKQESQHLRVITSQLVSFVSSIAAVTERLAPKLSQSTQLNEHENQMTSLLDEINAVQPDSQVRVDAIRDVEEDRQTQIANRTNPLDDELIKTKGLLRCPSLRNSKGERRKQKSDKDSTTASVAVATADVADISAAATEKSSDLQSTPSNCQSPENAAASPTTDQKATDPSPFSDSSASSGSPQPLQAAKAASSSSPSSKPPPSSCLVFSASESACQLGKVIGDMSSTAPASPSTSSTCLTGETGAAKSETTNKSESALIGDGAENKVVDVVLPAPSSASVLSAANLEASAPIEAFYDFLPYVPVASLCNGPVVKNCDNRSSPNSGKTAASAKNVDDVVILNVCSAVEDAKNKIQFNGSGTDIGSYVSLASSAGFIGDSLPVDGGSMRESATSENHSRDVAQRDKDVKISPPQAESRQALGAERSKTCKRRLQGDSCAASSVSEAGPADSGAAMKELMKDVENFDRKGSLTSPKK